MIPGPDARYHLGGLPYFDQVPWYGSMVFPFGSLGRESCTSYAVLRRATGNHTYHVWVVCIEPLCTTLQCTSQHLCHCSVIPLTLSCDIVELCLKGYIVTTPRKFGKGRATLAGGLLPVPRVPYTRVLVGDLFMLSAECCCSFKAITSFERLTTAEDNWRIISSGSLPTLLGGVSTL